MTPSVVVDRFPSQIVEKRNRVHKQERQRQCPEQYIEYEIYIFVVLFIKGLIQKLKNESISY